MKNYELLYIFFYILDNMSSVKTFHLVLPYNKFMDTIFCKNLKEARKACGLTQKQVALALDVVESCYANWEQGRTEPNIEMLRKLSRIFGVTLDDLINNPDF